MTDRQTIYDALSKAAWGYFFLYFDFNLGSVSILPSFVGYLLFLSAIKLLQNERRDLELLRPFGILLAAWHGGNWLASWLGTGLDGHFPVIDLIIGLANMYFHFQMLTDYAALATKYQQPDQTLDRRLLKWRTRQTLLLTAISLCAHPLRFLTDLWEPTLIILALAGLITSLCIMVTLFDLRKIFRGTLETLPPT
ncbi:hypothetical protein ACTQ4E_09025 [Lawsonibacter sp. LCP25S3_G6]|uniref:hypothetical protein n=1 Tax=unclassified Lawsonibacter TaxID=2617946 RepID=UPI003F9B47EF